MAKKKTKKINMKNVSEEELMNIISYTMQGDTPKELMVILGNLDKIKKNRKFTLCLPSMKRTAQLVKRLTAFTATQDNTPEDLEIDEVISAFLFYLLSTHRTMNDTNEDYKQMSDETSRALNEAVKRKRGGDDDDDDDDDDEPDEPADETCPPGKDEYVPRKHFNDPGVR